MTYNADGLLVILAYERQNQLDNDEGLAVPSFSGIRLGTRYKLNDLWQLAAFYQQTKNFSGGDRDAWGLGVGYKLGAYDLSAQYYQAESADTSSSNASMLALGVDRALNKAFSMYAAVAMTDNAERANFNVSGAGHGKRLTIAPGADPVALSVGAIYKF